MADISIQFHALPSELLPFVKTCISEFDLHLTAMRYRPFEVLEVNPHEMNYFFDDSSDHRRLAFTIDKPVVNISNELEFGKENPDHLRLDIARRTSHGLEESWLCARTDNGTALRVWKQVAKRLKAMTRSGVTAINRETGATATFTSARYTQGAKDLESRGVPMLPPQGPKGPRLVLGLVTTQDPNAK